MFGLFFQGNREVVPCTLKTFFMPGASLRQSATHQCSYAWNTQLRTQRRLSRVITVFSQYACLCNYDFIFMDINYTGRLAVSLYGILIQGCGHNGKYSIVALGPELCSPARGGTQHLFYAPLTNRPYTHHFHFLTLRRPRLSHSCKPHFSFSLHMCFAL